MQDTWISILKPNANITYIYLGAIDTSIVSTGSWLSTEEHNALMETNRSQKASEKIEWTELELYDDEWTIQKWDLYDESWVLSNENVFKRLKK